MKSIDQFLNRVPSDDYNCLDLAREVWLHLTGEDVRERLPQPVAGQRLSIDALRSMTKFKRIETPVSPCFALMQRWRMSPHIGIYIDGRILHLTASGVQFHFPEIALLYSSSVKYYK